ncbi:hypothetical protein [Ralstonia solanacearum]|uniref:hypothetical protein n=1 Tax=Ralstonia solanacearum TaxID=305 RepID=UPI0002E2776A|nr:hypothetical protein [Ralstonia solanacearum]
MPGQLKVRRAWLPAQVASRRLVMRTAHPIGHMGALSSTGVAQVIAMSGVD